MKPSINTIIKEQMSNCRLGYTDKSAVPEQSLTQVNHVRFEDAQVLTTSSNYSIENKK